MRSFLLVWSKLSATGSLAMLGRCSGITISLHCTRKTVSHSSPDTSQFAKQDSLPWDLPHFIINPYLPMYIYIYMSIQALFIEWLQTTHPPPKKLNVHDRTAYCRISHWQHGNRESMGSFGLMYRADLAALWCFDDQATYGHFACLCLWSNTCHLQPGYCRMPASTCKTRFNYRCRLL
jgi:hypothetical protein